MEGKKTNTPRSTSGSGKLKSNKKATMQSSQLMELAMDAINWGVVA